MSVIYPTLGDVTVIHDAELEESGGSAGLRDSDALQSAVLRPRQTFGADELYPDLPSKAAALFESLVCNHPFVDGNKRTAVSVAETFLDVNGAELVVPDDEFEQFTLTVAAGKLDFDDIAEWFRANTELPDG